MTLIIRSNFQTRTSSALVIMEVTLMITQYVIAPC